MYPMPDWAAAKIAVSNGTRNAKLIFLGESTTGGIYASGNGNEFGNALAQSYGAVAAASLSNASIQNFSGTQLPDTYTISDFLSMDPRFTSATSWTFNANTTLGAGFLESPSGNTNPLSFSPTSSFNTIECGIPKHRDLGRSPSMLMEAPTQLSTKTPLQLDMRIRPYRYHWAHMQ